MPPGLFEEQIRLLSNKRFNTISLQALYDYRKFNKKIPDKSIVLTFDDGYLDNWVYAYPILKKYGFKGTIFVSPEFVDPTENYRPNIEDVWRDACREEELITEGFLSWREMREMENKGIMDIQSHSMTHTWYFIDSKIIDFHHPGNNRYPWIFWNSRPDRKCYYLSEDQESFVHYGTPIYRNGRSLGIRKYFEDKKLNKYLVDFVNSESHDFFHKKDWRQLLFKQAEAYKSRNVLQDRYETNEEQEERFNYELTESKKILEENLEKKINFLCWAGGAFDNKALAIAQNAGYISSTTLYNDENIKNIFGEDPAEINRIGCVSEFNWHNKFISYTLPHHLVANIKLFYGEKWCFWLIRLYKMLYLVRYAFFRLLNKGE